ncbi:acyl--CoA ligase [[Bacteroides] pectinophilus]|uniref:AMP-dependent synthetase/ligase domain-containing protein n=1 Tax=[Bacteroides] pectinophilus ATCC 43243 TaxID=483218 RepID=B7ANH5_9FIRM|nr:AMP-binding enzyme [[Bacteroides] pectinophilus ATCC 43243]UWN96476.1 acyl--CoA ligase [[Bacteroides] pectinophilus]
MYDYLRKAVQQFPEKIAIKYKDVELSYSELDDVIKKIADECFSDIERCNIGIVVNSPMLFTMSLMAVSYIGCVAVPIYAYTGKEKIKELVKQFSLEYVIFEKGYDVLSCEESTTVLSDLIIHKEVSVGKNHSDKNCEIILLTSGTTGAPKGIMLSRDNIKSNVEAIGDYLRLTLNDKIFMVKNMNHSSSIIGELLIGLDNMCTIIFNSKILTASSMVNSILDNNITVFFAVPTILREIILKHKQLNLEKIGHLRIINFYGAPMSSQDIVKLVELLPNCNLIYSYGLTEASPRVTYIMGSDLLKKAGSSGRPIKNVKIEISNKGIDNNGEIVVSGPNVMLGYYNDAEKTRKTIVDGKLYTGDYGYIDEDGYLYVQGRKDNMIISAGKNIYPEEIEQVLQTAEGVKEVLVRNVSDDKGVEKFIAYIVTDDIEPNMSSLFEVCKNRLENYKIPSKFVYVKELEKTPSGKIVRKQQL